MKRVIVADPDNQSATEMVGWLLRNGASKPEAFKLKTPRTIGVLKVAWFLSLFVCAYFDQLLVAVITVVTGFTFFLIDARRRVRNRVSVREYYDQLVAQRAILEVPVSIIGFWERACRLHGYPRGLNQWDVVARDYFPVIRKIMVEGYADYLQHDFTDGPRRKAIEKLMFGWFREVIEDLKVGALDEDTQRQQAIKAHNEGIEAQLRITPSETGFLPQRLQDEKE